MHVKHTIVLTGLLLANLLAVGTSTRLLGQTIELVPQVVIVSVNEEKCSPYESWQRARSMAMDNYMKQGGIYSRRRAGGITGEMEVMRLETEKHALLLQCKRQMAETGDEHKAWLTERTARVTAEKQERTGTVQRELGADFHWPQVLLAEQFAPHRQRIESLISPYNTSGPDRQENLAQIAAACNDMKAELKGMIKVIRPGEYAVAKRFIDNLASITTLDPPPRRLAEK